jgi:hypothetical protein
MSRGSVTGEAAAVYVIGSTAAETTRYRECSLQWTLWDLNRGLLYRLLLTGSFT